MKLFALDLWGRICKCWSLHLSFNIYITNNVAWRLAMMTILRRETWIHIDALQVNAFMINESQVYHVLLSLECATWRILKIKAKVLRRINMIIAD